MPHDIELKNCWIDGKIALIAASTRRIDLNGSRIAELSVDGVVPAKRLATYRCERWWR
ncbi:protein of unknown function [Methylocella tundrae]|uniref:Uncharacterized protein n=1 Tax=Methylocella tundrae TaxID=227605 RepID=A0A4V6IMK3_METTU|nr:protein of unknown function [Methylocella tundrae]